MTIKHLVISGGAYKGFYTLGSLNYLSNINFYNIEEIETIYGGSVGGMIGLILCLKLDLKDVLEHAINRPWQNLFHFTAEDLLNIIDKKGLLSKDFVVSLFDNFFKNAGISKNATMKDLYNFSKITLYLFTVNIKSFKLETLSHETHPNMKILDAIYMSVAIPFIFQPPLCEDCYYVDGGVINPYPLNVCIKDGKNIDEILGFKIIDDKLDSTNEDASIFHFGFYLFYRLIKENWDWGIEGDIANEIIIPAVTMNITDARKIINDKSVREKMIDDGEKYAKLFLKYKSKNN